MGRIVAFAILAGVIDVAGAACSQPHKTSKWGMCSTKLVGSCVQKDCCMEDPRKCKSLSVTCPTGKFKDTAKDDTTPSDTIHMDPAIDCCSDVATCATAGCAKRKKGKKFIATPEKTKCTGGPSTCSETTCCELDATTCGVGNVNVNPACTADQYVNPAADAPDIKKNTNTCCLTKKKCSDASCSKKKLGLKLKTSAKDLNCPTDAASCDTSVCCEDDDTTCGVGNKNKACTAAQYINPAADTPDLKHANGQCCLAKATCKDAMCAQRGKGFKTTNAGTECPTNAASCSESTCCTNDDLKCGANGVNAQCNAATEVFRPGQEDEAKGANCCMNKMTCLALKTSVTCITGWTEYDSNKDLTVVTASAKNTKCCKPVTAWNKCPAPETKTDDPGTDPGTIGNPSGFDQLKPLACWRVALFVITMVSFRG